MSRARSPRASAKKHASDGVHGSLLGKHTKAAEPRLEHAGAETRPLHNAKPLWYVLGGWVVGVGAFESRSGPVVSTASAAHRTSLCREIRGRKYDLEEFLPRHPGGRELLEMVRGKGDITEVRSCSAAGRAPSVCSRPPCVAALRNHRAAIRG